MNDTARAYLAALTHGIPSNLYSYVWLKTPDGTTQKKNATHCFQGSDAKVLDAMAKLASDNMHSYDVYFGMGLSATKLTRYQRLKQPERLAAGIMALWCDIDFGTEGHKTDNLPTDEDEALAMFEEVFDLAPPSMAVASGGGFHVYWLLDEPLLADFGAIDPRELLRRWNNFLQASARKAGYAMDSMKDLERVLRIPGTLNHKPDYETPRPVDLVINEDRRYEAARLWNLCKEYTAGIVSDTSAKPRPAPVALDGDLAVDGRRGVNMAKWEPLYENSAKFRASWKHARSDIDNSLDNSSSVYEYSLINLMINAGWNDQEIIDGVTAWRLKHSEEPTERTLHYFEWSIGRARSERVAPPPPIDPPVDFAGIAAESGDDGTDLRAAACESLQRWLGFTNSVYGDVKIKRIVRYDGKESIYRIETSRGWIDMGGVANMAEFIPCSRRLYAAGYNVIAPRDQWLMIKQLTLRITEVETIPEISATGLVLNLLEEYLEKRPMKDTAQDAEEGRDPFWHEGGRGFFLRSFVEWCGINATHEKLGSADIANALRAANVESITLHVKDSRGKPTTRHAWRIAALREEKINESEGNNDATSTTGAA